MIFIIHDLYRSGTGFEALKGESKVDPDRDTVLRTLVRPHLPNMVPTSLANFSAEI